MNQIYLLLFNYQSPLVCEKGGTFTDALEMREIKMQPFSQKKKKIL